VWPLFLSLWNKLINRRVNIAWYKFSCHLQLLRRIRYIVSILTKADMAASQRYVRGNGINTSRAPVCQSRICLQHTAPKFHHWDGAELGLCGLIENSNSRCSPWRLNCSLSFISAIKVSPWIYAGEDSDVGKLFSIFFSRLLMWTSIKHKPYVNFLITNFIVQQWKPRQNSGFLHFFSIGITSFWRRDLLCSLDLRFIFPLQRKIGFIQKTKDVCQIKDSLGIHRHQIV